MRVCHYLPPVAAAAALLAVGDEADVLDARLPQLVHRRHHRAVLDFLVGLDEDDLLLLVLEQLVDLRRQLAFLHRLGVQVHRLVWRRSAMTVWSCVSGLSTVFVGRRQLDG